MGMGSVVLNPTSNKPPRKRSIPRLKSAQASFGDANFVTSMTAPAASAGTVAGWGRHPLESAALSQRTPGTGIALAKPSNRRRRADSLRSKAFWEAK